MENLPPGYRFYPTEEELVHFYLRHKVEGLRELDLLYSIDRVIKTMDIYEFNPWDLPQLSGEACIGDPEQWFFFIPKQESEIRGGRPRRLTAFGYWKATGSPGCVYAKNRIIGVRRTMVFYNGRAPKGAKTEWKMNEYKLIDEEASSLDNSPPQLRDEYSLCRVYKKSKSLRAFDRRPTTGVDHTGEVLVDNANHHDEQNMNNASSSAIMVVERALNASPEYSTSSSVEDDHHRVSRSSRDHQSSSSSISSAPNLLDNNEPLWDWEQLQWF